MTKEFEALARIQAEEWADGWHSQHGPGATYKDLESAYRAGAHYGREAGLDEAAGIAEKRVRCQTNYDMCREAEIIAKAIRAAKGNT